MASASEPNPTPELLLRDVPCVACGFNLRGLAANGACPDCGAPVARSLATAAAPPTSPVAPAREGTGAAAAPPTAPRPRAAAQYTLKARRGFSLVLWGIGAEIVLAACAAINGMALGMILGAAVWAIYIVLTLLTMIARIVQTRGWWMVTAPEAFGPSERAPDLKRGFCRTMVLMHLLLSLFSSMIWICLSVLALLQDSWPTNFAGVQSLPMFFEAVLAAAAFVAKMMFIARLGAWIGSPSLERSARTWLWIGPALVIVGRGLSTFSRLTGMSWLAFTGTRFDVLFPPTFWLVAAVGAWLVVHKARNELARGASQ